MHWSTEFHILCKLHGQNLSVILIIDNNTIWWCMSMVLMSMAEPCIVHLSSCTNAFWECLMHLNSPLIASSDADFFLIKVPCHTEWNFFHVISDVLYHWRYVCNVLRTTSLFAWGLFLKFNVTSVNDNSCYSSVDWTPN